VCFWKQRWFKATPGVSWRLHPKKLLEDMGILSHKQESINGRCPYSKGTLSLPFKKGDNAKIAVKIIDDRGIESLRVISL